MSDTAGAYGRPHPRSLACLTVAATGDDHIFVAVASYCDPELNATVADAMARAERPDRVRFGILHQYDEDGPDDIREQAVAPLAADPRLRVHVRDHRESKGGGWARHHVQGLYQGEAWTLQVDAHTRFADGWDTELIAMATAVPVERPAITGFPPPYFVIDGVDHVNRDRRLPVPCVCVEHWSDEGWLSHPTRVVDHDVAVPVPARILSGAFVFAPGRWNEDVRQDPQSLYAGEEFALTLRSFTHGYDLVQPGPGRGLAPGQRRPATQVDYRCPRGGEGDPPPPGDGPTAAVARR